MRQYARFKLQVKHLSKPKDFKENQYELTKIEKEDYQLFFEVLKAGSEIIPAITIVEKLTIISSQILITTKEVLRLSRKFRFINSLFDLQKYP